MIYFLILAAFILIFTPLFSVWFAHVFRFFRSYKISVQIMLDLAVAVAGFLLAWLSLLSHNEILILGVALLDIILLIANTVKGIINLRSRIR